jgi:uncharacterized protein
MPRDYSLEQTPATSMRRSELSQDDEWIRAFLQQAEVGYIASQWDDQPFITPKNFCYDPEQHEIYFHSAQVGRLRANIERNPRVSMAAARMGELLPSNVALEFGVQYESVIVFGRVHLIDDPQEQRRALDGMLLKYFPDRISGEHYRPITDQELKRTAVYAIAIESWSGKRNWNDQAVQSPDWPPLSAE